MSKSSKYNALFTAKQYYVFTAIKKKVQQYLLKTD